MTQDVHRTYYDYGKYNYQWYQGGKLSQNSYKLIIDFGLLLCKKNLVDETDKCRYCAAEDKDLNVILSLLFGMPLILIIANSL